MFPIPRNTIHTFTLSLTLGLAYTFTGLYSSEFRREDRAAYTGAKACGSCHKKEYDTWAESGHATSFNRLSSSERHDPTCLGCHTMVPVLDSRFENAFSHLQNVQCESCHGAGRDYSNEAIMKDPNLSRRHGLVDPTEEVCVQCHNREAGLIHDFDYAGKLEPIRHWNYHKEAPATESPAASTP